MNYSEKALKQAAKLQGKIEVVSKVKIKTKDDLATAYTPGVAAVSLAIARNKNKVYDLTIKSNTVAVVSDGSAVLGLGNIGPEAALPVMEGKCLLFSELGGVNAIPIVLATQETDEIVKIVRAIAPGFGGINLEDISAPRCFEIESKLQNIGIPVFHDDQHGTAIVVAAALENALKVVRKNLSQVKIVIAGAGAAGIAIAKFLKPKSLIMFDSKGPIYRGRKDLNFAKTEVANLPYYKQFEASLEKALVGANVFIGVSGSGKLQPDQIRKMRDSPIIFALSNPAPEILPDIAKAAGAAIVATGRSDFPNQVNNSLVFPGIFAGALKAHAKKITREMKRIASKTLAAQVKKPNSDSILPSSLDKKVAQNIAKAVSSVI